MLDIEVFIEKIKKKSRILGVDPGAKRIGIAISDENKIVATPYTTIIKENYANLVSQIGEILDPIADKILIVFILFGLSVNLTSYFIAFISSLIILVLVLSEKKHILFCCNRCLIAPNFLFGYRGAISIIWVCAGVVFISFLFNDSTKLLRIILCNFPFPV